MGNFSLFQKAKKSTRLVTLLIFDFFVFSFFEARNEEIVFFNFFTSNGNFKFDFSKEISTEVELEDEDDCDDADSWGPEGDDRPESGE